MNNTGAQTLQAELSAAAVWLTLHPADWCVFDLTAGRLDVAVDTASPAALLCDLADEGFRVQVDERAQVAQVDGHRLQVRLCYAPPFRVLARSATYQPVLGQALPVAAPLCGDVLAA